MNRLFKIIGIGFIGATTLLTSCDKVVNPVIIQTELDTLLFPGNFIDYEWPTFEENTNTLRNVLLEEFTGHQCPGCPAASETAESIADAHPGRVFILGIHAGFQGKSSLQATSDDYPYDFTTPEGIEIANRFSTAEFGLFSNPKGTVNRVAPEGSTIVMSSGEWATSTENILSSDLKVNIQVKSNYYPTTKGAYLHVETEFLEEIAGDLSLVVYVAQNEFVSPQKKNTERIVDYEHHHIHIGNVFGEAWGRGLGNTATEKGTKIYSDLSYKLPDNLAANEIHFLVAVYDKDTYEVLQVVKHTL